MNMDWIADLKCRTREMHQQIRLFCDEYPIQQPQEQEIIENLIHGTDNFGAWIRALPSDANVWQWVHWNSAFDNGNRLLAGVYFNFLLMLTEQNKYVGNPQPLSVRAQMAQNHINLVLNTYNQSQTKHDKFMWTFQAKTERIPPYIVLAALWPLVYRWCLDYALSRNAIEMQTWPMVLYHPYYTPITLNEIIQTFARSTHDILVTPRRQEAAFEIWITHPTLSISPAFWETLLEGIDSYDGIERLREIGASIEPLTWDEGQGQGVIVRLPWAKA